MGVSGAMVGGRVGAGDGLVGVAAAGCSTIGDGASVGVGGVSGCDFVSKGSGDGVGEAVGDDSATEGAVAATVSTSWASSRSGAEVGVQARTVTVIIIAPARTNHLRINNRHSIILQ